MSHVSAAPVSLPREGRCPFDPPEILRHGDNATIRRMRYPDGHLGWLVTGYTAARAVLMDQRFSVRPELHHPPFDDGELQHNEVPPGVFAALDPPDHTRFRRILSSGFSPRTVRQIEPAIEHIVATQLDDMQASGSPADLMAVFALPVHSRVICHILGVPNADLDRFASFSAIFTNRDVNNAGHRDKVVELLDYLLWLIDEKRRAPAADLMSGLAAQSDLTDEEICGATMLLFSAGHETTINTFALGLLALLSNSDQLALLSGGSIPVADLVEELLRYVCVVDIRVRTALEDLTLEGHTITAGESVTLSLAAANRDPRSFEHPLALAVDRPEATHLGFGHGMHQCLGQHLARTELRLGFAGLLSRLPTIRLAVPSDALRMCNDLDRYGIYELPVAW